MAARTSTRPQGLSKSMRLRRRRDFVAVQSSGRKFHGAGFLVLVVRNPASRPLGRVGFTVTKRIGNAVTRNRIKRSAREWLRRHGWVPAGVDVVLIAKESVLGLSPGALTADLNRLIQRVAA